MLASSPSSFRRELLVHQTPADATAGLQDVSTSRFLNRNSTYLSIFTPWQALDPLPSSFRLSAFPRAALSTPWRSFRGSQAAPLWVAKTSGRKRARLAAFIVQFTWQHSRCTYRPRACLRFAPPWIAFAANKSMPRVASTDTTQRPRSASRSCAGTRRRAPAADLSASSKAAITQPEA